MRNAGRKKRLNIIPALREEILENPDSVFLIRTGVQSTRMDNGKYPSENEQMERNGFETAMKMFRKGTRKGGLTCIKPNFVYFYPKDGNNLNNGFTTHPYFTAGYCDALRSMGNTNIIVSENGGSPYEDYVSAGVTDLFKARDVIFMHGKYGHYKYYTKDEITWRDYPEGRVMLKVPFFTPFIEPDATFINMAKSRIHNLAVTSLTTKNLQGIMPVGFMHICNGWPTGLTNVIELEPRKKIINPDYQKIVETNYLKHSTMGYKYYDDAGCAKTYFSSGGWEAFRKGSFTPDFLTFREEQWSQRIMDVASNIAPAVNMVEGIFGADIYEKPYLNNFIVISRSMTACDSVATWLMGHDPREVFYLRIAKERGLGENDIEKIPLYELEEKTVRRIGDYRELPRARMVTVMHAIKSGPERFF
jgi:uncharacterized protein (DUF362 family)